MNYGYVYESLDKRNNMLYIGRNKGLFETEYHGSGDRIVNIINKYGNDTFITKVIDWADNLTELKSKEKAYIASYRIIYTRNGLYNIADGGTDGMSGRRHTAESNHKNRIAKLGKTLEEIGHKTNCPCSFCKVKRGEMKGVSHTKEHNINIGKSLIGHKMSKESINRMRSKLIGRKDSIETLEKKRLAHLRHKPDCQCMCCKSKRHEYIGENSPRFNKTYHKK